MKAEVTLKDGIEGFAERLRFLMFRNGISQVELSRKVGCSKHTIYKYTIGKTTPRIDRLYQISNALGCSIDWLALGKE